MFDQADRYLTNVKPVIDRALDVKDKIGKIYFARCALGYLNWAIEDLENTPDEKHI